MFLVALFTIAKREKQPQCPPWMNGKTEHRHIYAMEYHSSPGRNEVLTHSTTRMNIKDIILREVNQSQRGQILCNSTFISHTE